MRAILPAAVRVLAVPAVGHLVLVMAVYLVAGVIIHLATWIPSTTLFAGFIPMFATA